MLIPIVLSWAGFALAFHQLLIPTLRPLFNPVKALAVVLVTFAISSLTLTLLVGSSGSGSGYIASARACPTSVTAIDSEGRVYSWRPADDPTAFSLSSSVFDNSGLNPWTYWSAVSAAASNCRA